MKLSKLCFLCVLLLLTLSCKKEETLKSAYHDYFYIGTAINQYQLSGGDPKAVAIAENQFNSITPENLLKWEKVHPEPDSFNFAPVKKFIEFGEKHKMFMVGHTLVWHNQTPDWVFADSSGKAISREMLLQRLHDHIFTVVGYCKGKVGGWDVVNEAVEDDGQLRNSRWLQIIGEDYIQKAFEWAHEADPDAELYYNDYNMWLAGKREGVVKLVSDLLAKGIRVDGIGLQGHWGLDYPPLDELEASIQAYTGLGVNVMITEFDVDVLPYPANYQGADITQNYELQQAHNPYAQGLPDSMQNKLAERYVEFFNILKKYSAKVSRVTFWGVHDGVSWRNDWPIRGRTDYPLLFDRNYQPKPAYFAVMKLATGESTK